MNINRTGSLPNEAFLMKKLHLNAKQFNELIFNAQEYGMDINPETFEFRAYCKLNKHHMQYGTDDKAKFSYEDFLKFKKELDEKILVLDFSNDDFTEDLLEVAGTILNFLEILISNINDKELVSNKPYDHIERDYEEIMTVYGKQKVILTAAQLKMSIDKFLEPFITIFMKVGIVFEAYDREIEEPYNEEEIIKEYNQLDFKEIKSFLKLFEDGQLG
jgi:hypothetical protein|tara:strand:- start:688 stop:1338 length:651 start_codon:yes stop_codon:yes gene_type:complete